MAMTRREVLEAATVAEETAPVEELTPSERRHLRALEGRVERGLRVFYEVGEALAEIRDSRLYRLTHATFEAYCRDRWQMDRVRAYQYMKATEVVKALGSPKELKNEGLVRNLVPTYNQDPSALPGLWKKVKKVAKAENRPLTVELVRAVVRTATNGKKNGDEAPPETIDTATNRLIRHINRLGMMYATWKESKPNIGERRRVAKAIEDLRESIT